MRQEFTVRDVFRLTGDAPNRRAVKKFGGVEKVSTLQEIRPAPGQNTNVKLYPQTRYGNATQLPTICLHEICMASRGDNEMF
ncbi:hypothetical protein CGZ80_15095 [Rhodopirellula sp. MGV]|nr:hypothetical protein CGZ80_15095 [Rhodopirellula sp. MGV]PNY37443.1 hypothetical protein C2E31_07930 [Rhodopirellula baltica]